MSFRFAIIGAGWYGSHIASSFRALGFDVQLFDREHDLLAGASGNNQYRLHLGFHYARNYRTRMQSRDGYLRFIERYPYLSASVKNNIYAVPDQDSLIDFTTYRLIMTSSGVEFSEINPKDYGISSCDGALLTEERVLLIRRAREYFRRRLDGCLRLGEAVNSIEERYGKVYVNGESFDYLVDATWGHFFPIDAEVFYEPTMLLYYKSDTNNMALTMVDGDLCSVYPTEEDGLYTLSSVPHTPLGRYTSSLEARNALEKVDSDLVYKKKMLMEQHVSRYLPHFTDTFEFVEPQLSIKTKLVGQTDDRSCYVAKHGRSFVVMSGKIDTIFFASERILSLIEAEHESVLWEVA